MVLDIQALIALTGINVAMWWLQNKTLKDEAKNHTDVIFHIKINLKNL